MADPAFIKNPWSAEHWNLTRQGEYVRKYGMERAQKKADEVGATIGALRPRSMAPGGLHMMPIPARNFTVIVQRRGVTTEVGGGGLIGAGSSGSGPPGG